MAIRVARGMSGLAAVALLAACVGPVEVGRAAYQADCAGCHGVDGRGGGPSAGGLPVPPSDLTLIAARNGGVFDRNAVMSTIDGYFRRGDPNHTMPEYGATLEGRLVLVDTGDGVLTPTPDSLVALAAYLESIQR